MPRVRKNDWPTDFKRVRQLFITVHKTWTILTVTSNDDKVASWRKYSWIICLLQSWNYSTTFQTVEKTITITFLVCWRAYKRLKFCICSRSTRNRYLGSRVSNISNLRLIAFIIKFKSSLFINYKKDDEIELIENSIKSYRYWYI